MAEIEDPKAAEAEAQRQETVKKLVSEGLAEAMKPFQTQLETDKAEKAGLDAKIAALLAEKENATKEADATSGTLQQQIEGLRTDREKDRLASEADKAKSAVDLKRATWESEAAKLKLPDGTVAGMKDTFTAEEGTAWMKQQAEGNTKAADEIINQRLGAGWKPGSGGLDPGGAESTDWGTTDDSNIAGAEAEMQAELKKATSQTEAVVAK